MKKKVGRWEYYHPDGRLLAFEEYSDLGVFIKGEYNWEGYASIKVLGNSRGEAIEAIIEFFDEGITQTIDLTESF